MHCIITAGPTYESLDQVRRLTNFSTGQLGTELANSLVAAGHTVTLLKGYYAIYRGEDHAQEVVSFSTTEDLRNRLQSLANPRVGAVFHAAAVSDFGFGQVFRRTTDGQLEAVQAGKFPTSYGALLVELVPTRKIIAELRGWFPSAWLAGWKYEVDGDRSCAVSAGVEQIRRCQTDGCVVNGAAYGSGFGLVRPAQAPEHFATSKELFHALGERMQGSR